MLGELVTRSQQKITWLFSQYCTKQRLVNRKEKILDHCYFHKSSGQGTLSSNSAQGLCSPYKLWILIGSTVRRNRGDRLWGLELECETNRRFPSYLSPLFQSESWCEAVHMEISFIHMQIWVHFHVNKTNFHMKGFALGLALVQRRNGTRKSPILLTLHIISCQIERIKIIFHSETVASFVLSFGRSCDMPLTCAWCTLGANREVYPIEPRVGTLVFQS